MIQGGVHGQRLSCKSTHHLWMLWEHQNQACLRTELMCCQIMMRHVACEFYSRQWAPSLCGRTAVSRLSILCKQKDSRTADHALSSLQAYADSIMLYAST